MVPISYNPNPNLDLRQQSCARRHVLRVVPAGATDLRQLQVRVRLRAAVAVDVARGAARLGDDEHGHGGEGGGVRVVQPVADPLEGGHVAVDDDEQLGSLDAVAGDVLGLGLGLGSGLGLTLTLTGQG